MDIYISREDRQALRDVAKRQLELANRESNREREREWYRHNDLQGEKPMVQLEMWGFTHEIIPQRLHCEGAFARSVETKMYTDFLNQELFDDDRVTPDYYAMNYDTWFVPFDIDAQVEYAKGADGENGLGQHFVPVIGDLEEDYGKLKTSSFGVDRAGSERKREVIEAAIGDILPVRMKMDALYSVPMQMLVHIMSMETMMYALIDYPELFKETLDRIAEDTLAYYRMLERERLILPTTSFEQVAQGTWAFTRNLPGWEEWEKRPFTTKDVWGFMDAQETVSVSPDTYEEIVFPCYRKISGEFGLLSYGCCEPVSRVWDRCISKLPNLRKVSVSPWCDEAFMGERLAGSGVIYQRKPSAVYLGVGTVLDEEAVRKHIRHSLECARGCRMEITQRDVYTINHDIPKARRYVELIRDEIERHWK